MKEYIEREAVLKIVEKYGCSNGSVLGYHSGAIDCAGSEIDKLPAADVVEVRHGRWIDKGWDGDASWQIDGRGNCWHVYECSECNAQQKGETMNYCPNCGAKMDKEE